MRMQANNPVRELVLEIPVLRKESRVIKLAPEENLISLIVLHKSEQIFTICLHCSKSKRRLIKYFISSDDANRVFTIEAKNYDSFSVSRPSIGLARKFMVYLFASEPNKKPAEN
jgi:hypothetical protein